jgi:hypothetical protein
VVAGRTVGLGTVARTAVLLVGDDGSYVTPLIEPSECVELAQAMLRGEQYRRGLLSSETSGFSTSLPARPVGTVVGTFRAGRKVGIGDTSHPEPLESWRITSKREDVLQELSRHLGGSVKRFEGGFELAEVGQSVRVVVDKESVRRLFLRLVAGKRSYCDGHSSAGGTVPCTCSPVGQSCDAVVELSFGIAGAEHLGRFVFRSKGKQAVDTLPGSVASVLHGEERAVAALWLDLRRTMGQRYVVPRLVPTTSREQLVLGWVNRPGRAGALASIQAAYGPTPAHLDPPGKASASAETPRAAAEVRSASLPLVSALDEFASSMGPLEKAARAIVERSVRAIDGGDAREATMDAARQLKALAFGHIGVEAGDDLLGWSWKKVVGFCRLETEGAPALRALQQFALGLPAPLIESAVADVIGAGDLMAETLKALAVQWKLNAFRYVGVEPTYEQTSGKWQDVLAEVHLFEKARAAENLLATPTEHPAYAALKDFWSLLPENLGDEARGELRDVDSHDVGAMSALAYSWKRRIYEAAGVEPTEEQLAQPYRAVVAICTVRRPRPATLRMIFGETPAVAANGVHT